MGGGGRRRGEGGRRLPGWQDPRLWIGVMVWGGLLLFAVAWLWVAVERWRERGERMRPATTLMNALGAPRVIPAAALATGARDLATEARGRSGRLRVVIADPDSAVALRVPAGMTVLAGAGVREAIAAGDTLAGGRAPREPGVWSLVLAAGQAMVPVGDLSIITRRPLAERKGVRMGTYVLGVWPTERRRVPGYATPTGAIEVTEENQDLRVSEHFRLRDFLTKGQAGVWPKYLVLDLRLVDKLELVLMELERSGVETAGVRVMSGFRTPTYNESGGNTAGRAAMSRHMYGDAADIYLDRDGNGVMDDLNGDGRVTVDDARVIVRAAERVERAHPDLVGGVGLYAAGSGHGPFVHIDARGVRARW